MDEFDDSPSSLIKRKDRSEKRDGGADRPYKAVRLTFDTQETPDSMIVRSFDDKDLEESSAFPTLHRTIEAEKKRPWEAAQPKPAKEVIVAPLPVQRYVPLEIGIAQQIQGSHVGIIEKQPPVPDPAASPKGKKKKKNEVPPPPMLITTQQYEAEEKAAERRKVVAKLEEEWGIHLEPVARPPSAKGGKATAGKARPTSAASKATGTPRTPRKDESAVEEEKVPWRLPENLKTISASFKALMNKDGTITAQNLTEALSEFSVTDIVAVDDLFTKLDIHKDRKVVVSTILKSFDDIINGSDHKTKIRRACFEILHLDGKGYIHKAHLEKIKQLQKLGITHTGMSADDVGGEDLNPRAAKATGSNSPHSATVLMIKVMSDIFQDVLKQEEEDFLNAGAKGKKKKKKVPALPPNRKSHIPLNKMRIAHISFEVFCQYFDQSRELAAAFLPCWLAEFLGDGHLLHTVVMKRIDEVEEARRLQKEKEEQEANAAQETDA